MRCLKAGTAASPTDDLDPAAERAKELCQQVQSRGGRGIRSLQEANKTASSGSSGLSQGKSVTEDSGDWVRKAEAAFNALVMPSKRKVRVRRLLPFLGSNETTCQSKVGD